MVKIKLFIASFVFFLLFASLNLIAQEQDGRFRELKRLYDHAMELAKDGDTEESRRVMDTVNEMRRSFREESPNAKVRSRKEIAEFERERQYLRSLVDRGVPAEEAREIRDNLERLGWGGGENEMILDGEGKPRSRNLDRRNERSGDPRKRPDHSHEHEDHGHEDFWHEGREHGGDRNQHHEPNDEWEARLNHLSAAAEHLHVAGLYDLAEQVESQIRNLEKERHGDESFGLESLVHELMARVDEFDRQIDGLRQEVRRLKR
jgi:hypothetical protein